MKEDSAIKSGIALALLQQATIIGIQPFSYDDWIRVYMEIEALKAKEKAVQEDLTDLLK